MSQTESGNAFVGGVLCGGVLVAVVCAIFCFAMNEEYRREAVQHGAAEYDTVTGVWRWKAPILPPK